MKELPFWAIFKIFPNLPVGQMALQLMIVHEMSEGELYSAIALAESGRALFTGEAQKENWVNLIMLYLRTGQLQKAEGLFTAFKARYPDEANFTELLQGMFEHIAHDLVHSQAGSSPQTRVLAQESPTSEISERSEPIPDHFALLANYPNPFNPATTIRYQLPQASHVTLKIYNLLGQEIRTLVDVIQEAGFHNVRWDGRDDSGAPVSSGVYLVRLVVRESLSGGKAKFVQSRKLALVK